MLADLRAEGRRVSKKTVEVSMARQGLQARSLKRRQPLDACGAVPWPGGARERALAPAHW